MTYPRISSLKTAAAFRNRLAELGIASSRIDATDCRALPGEFAFCWAAADFGISSKLVGWGLLEFAIGAAFKLTG